MTEKDEFDTGLELDDNVADSFDDTGFDDADPETEDAPVKAKKSGGGFFVKFLLLLVLLGGGVFASVKYLGVQLPFDVPFLSELAAGDKAPPQPVAANPAASPADTQTAAVIDTGNWGTADTMVPVEDNVMVGDETLAFDNTMPSTEVGIVDPADTGTLSGVGVSDSFGLPVTADDTFGTGDTDVSAWPATDDAASSIDMADNKDAVIDFAPAADTVVDDSFGVPSQDTAVTSASDLAAFGKASGAQATTTTATAVKGVTALEKKIAALEKTVQQLESSTASKKDVDDLKASLVKIEKSVAGLKGAPAAVSAPKKSLTAETGADVKAAPVKAAAKKPAVRKGWILRSAKPGMAWISEKNSSEMKTVSVGDTVAGIGKVTAIAKDDTGRWVVSGTSGKINQ